MLTRDKNFKKENSNKTILSRCPNTAESGAIATSVTGHVLVHVIEHVMEQRGEGKAFIGAKFSLLFPETGKPRTGSRWVDNLVVKCLQA